MQNKKIIFTLFIIIFAFISIFVLKIADFQDEYVAKIDGNKVSKEEYYVYLKLQKSFFESKGGEDIWETTFDGETAENQAKQNALKQIALVKQANIQAKNMNISLTDEEKKIVEDNAIKLLEEMPTEYMEPNKDSFEIITKTMEEMEILNKVYEEVTKNFVLSESDFDAYFKQYLEDEKNNIVEIKGSYIYFQSPDENGKDTIEKATQVHEKATSGEDFHQLVKQYSDDYISDDTILIENIGKSSLPSQVIEMAYTMNAGEISDIISMDNGYYILKIEEIYTPDLEVLEQNVKEDYIKMKKDEIFYQELEKWQDKEPKVEINQEIWDSISITQLD